MIFITQKKDAFLSDIFWKSAKGIHTFTSKNPPKYFLQNGSCLMNLHASSDNTSQNSLKA